MFILEIRGSDVPPSGGGSPDETYGQGVWGPAIFGAANRTGLTDSEASTFESREVAYGIGLTLLYLAPLLETRIRELP